MIWKHHILLFGILILFLSACDSFEEDTEPKGENELQVKGSISALPGTTLFIDLKKQLNTSNVVKFGIGVEPARGIAEISGEAILSYVPKTDFLTGSDFLLLELFNASGDFIDSDSITIVMADSAQNLPCFNGALSDYYTTHMDQRVTLYPILNDGYCFSQTSGAVINLISSPMHGTVENIEQLFAYQYLPESGFIGHDSFMYELELIDLDGNSDFSLAQINIEVIAKQDSSVWSPCDSLIHRPLHYSFQKPKQESYILPPVLEDPFCGSIGQWNVSLISVAHGSAEVTEIGHIKYFPGASDSDVIYYNLLLASDTIRKTIVIEFTGGTNCTAILQANDDFYEFTFDNDTIGNSTQPYLFDPAANDVHCFGYSLDIVDYPHLGVAEIIHGIENDGIPLIRYYSEEEFAGTQTTSLTYQICDGVDCKQAIVHLTLIK